MPQTATRGLKNIIKFIISSFYRSLSSTGSSLSFLGFIMNRYIILGKEKKPQTPPNSITGTQDKTPTIDKEVKQIVVNAAFST